MFNFKLNKKWKKNRLVIEFGSNNSNPESKTNDLMTKLILLSLEIGSLISIWKWLIIPLFIL